jgi:hypothetical protein
MSDMTQLTGLCQLPYGEQTKERKGRKGGNQLEGTNDTQESGESLDQGGSL